jgi:hypothetical protein
MYTTQSKTDPCPQQTSKADPTLQRNKADLTLVLPAQQAIALGVKHTRTAISSHMEQQHLKYITSLLPVGSGSALQHVTRGVVADSHTQDTATPTMINRQLQQATSCHC